MLERQLAPEHVPPRHGAVPDVYQYLRRLEENGYIGRADRGFYYPLFGAGRSGTWQPTLCSRRRAAGRCIRALVNVAQSTISNDLRGIIRPDNSSKRGPVRSVRSVRFAGSEPAEN